MNDVNDKNTCFQNCDGMYVTSFEKKEFDGRKLELKKKFLTAYEEYKGKTSFPLKLKSKNLSFNED